VIGRPALATGLLATGLLAIVLTVGASGPVRADVFGCEAADMAAATSMEGRSAVAFDPVRAGPLSLSARVSIDCAAEVCAIRTDVATLVDGVPVRADGVLAPIGMDPATGELTGSEVMLSAPGNAAAARTVLKDSRIAEGVRRRGWRDPDGRDRFVDTQMQRIGPIGIRRRVALACGPERCEVDQRTIVAMGYDDDGRFACGDVGRIAPLG